MIPRTKVNYDLKHLLRAFFITDFRGCYQDLLVYFLQEYLQEPNILLMPSGRAGLFFLLKALPQSKVIVPGYTCKAVVEAAKMANKTVIYSEVNSYDFNMSVTELQKVVDEDSIVVATHQYGIPCNIYELINLCRQKNAIVIEDVAAALGTRVRNQLVGTFGDAAFYSFDSTKLINVPLKAGFLTAKDLDLFQKVRDLYELETEQMPFLHKLSLLLKAGILVAIENHFFYRLFHTIFFEWRGKFTEDSPEISLERTSYYRYRMSNWQCFIAYHQLKIIDDLIRIRQFIYKKYIKELQNDPNFILPPHDSEEEWACIRFPIQIREDKISFYNEAVKKGLDFAFSFTFITSPNNYASSHSLAKSILNIPYYTKLSNKEFEKVVSILRSMSNYGKLVKNK